MNESTRKARERAAIRAREEHRDRPHRSEFTSHLENAYWYLQQAAHIAQDDVLTETENDYGWSRVAKLKYEIARIEERLYRPSYVKKDADEEFAELLGRKREEDGNG